MAKELDLSGFDEEVENDDLDLTGFDEEVEPTSAAEAVARGAAQGLTFDFEDELQAAGEAIYGDIKDVAVVEDVVYFHVKRTINGSAVYTIEALDNNTYTDSAVHVVNSPASATVTGLDHLNSKECRVRADGSVMDNATPSSGSITLARTATNVEVGINYDIEVKTMPVNVTFGSGPINATKRRILRVSAQLYQALDYQCPGE